MNSLSVFDSPLLGALFATDQVRRIFATEHTVTLWLNVEATLAEAQAELGIIPAQAAADIRTACDPAQIDIDTLAKGTRETSRPIKPLLAQIRTAGSKLVADYLHYGTTTQDVMDTSAMLQLADAVDSILASIDRLIELLADRAEKHKATVMVARTNGQDAVPTTFGLHLVSYVTEMDRTRQRLAAERKRLCVQFGSTVGTLAPFSAQGLELRKRFAEKLNLAEPDGPWNNARDITGAVVQNLALVGALLGRIGTDITTMSRTAIGEVAEAGEGASSTMPHKRNPRCSEFLMGISRLAKMYGSAVPDMMAHEDTRSGGAWIIEWAVVPEAFSVASAGLERAIELFTGLQVNASRMRQNVLHSRGFAMSEAVMNALVTAVGRADAYDTMKAAITDAGPDDTLRDVIDRNENIKEMLKGVDVDALLRPENYLGSAMMLVEKAVETVRCKI